MSSNHSPPEGIYRRISVRMWGDERFMRLSPLPPSGQALWLYLLSGPHTGPIPGLFVIGRAALAETLGWEPEDFQKAFAEVIGEGLVQFDVKTRLWFIPKAVKHNMPANPNVVRSWRNQWSLIPECEMRDRVFEALKAALHGLSEAFGKAFEETCDKASGKALAKHSPKQETGSSKQQQIRSAVDAGRFDDFWSLWPKSQRKGAKSECARVWRNLSLDTQADVILAHVRAMAGTESWTKSGGQFVPAPLTYLRGRRWDGAELDGGSAECGRPDSYTGAVL
jgi:hypothetical protein